MSIERVDFVKAVIAGLNVAINELESAHREKIRALAAEQERFEAELWKIQSAPFQPKRTAGKSISNRQFQIAPALPQFKKTQKKRSA